MTLRFEACGLTHTGLLRHNNEDSFLLDEAHELFMVADGMGGHAAGEIASKMAVEQIRDFIANASDQQRPSWPYPTPREYPIFWQRMMAAVMSANAAIYRNSRESQHLSGMGTTVVALSLDGDSVVFAHVGDSRLYLFRDGKLSLQTEDHSWIQEQINQGNLTEEEAARHPLRNVITRALGGASAVSVDVGSIKPLPEDLFLLCTDGLTTMVPDQEIEEILLKHHDLNQAADQLIQTANQMGGHDNTTVVVIRIRE